MENTHAMTIRKLIATSLLTMLTTAMVMLAPLSSAISVNLDVSTDSNSDMDDEACEEYQSGLSAIVGCDNTDQIVDFTEYTGELTGPDATGYDDALTQSTDARDFIQTIVNFALSFLGLIATIVVIYGGIMYVMSRGDEEMATKGKKSIGYAAVGILIILGSFAMVNTLIGAGGGGSDGALGGSDGTTIMASGADFDVDGVLAQLENTLGEYISVYGTYVEVASEIEYLRGLEMPFIVVAKSEENGFWDSWLEGEDWDNDGAGDKGTDYFVDESWVSEYASDLQKGAKSIQESVDSLSSTYEYAQILYDYLRSGSSVYGTLSFLQTQDKPLFARFAPAASAAAADEAETLEALYKHFLDTYHGGSCAEPVEAYEATYTDEEGIFASFGWNPYEGNDDEYTFKLMPLDYKVCDYLDDVNTYLDADYTEQVGDIIDEFLILEGLFSTEGIEENYGSTLSQVNALFETIVDSGSQQQSGDCSYYEGTLGSAKCVISSKTVRDVANSIDDLYAMVQNLQFVKVALTASDTSGNAPLIVEFDALGTEDPSGNTVNPDQIYWDLDGDGEFNEANGDDGDGTGDAVSKTYDKAGTYRVKVRVVSQSDEIAAGLATVTIKVEPPASSIVIKATAGGEPAATIADFREFPEVDKSYFKITAAEAQEGITFDASETTDGDGNTGESGGIIKYTWDMGDSNTISGGYADAKLVNDYKYVEGTYTVSLTVMDSTGEEDRKYFTLYVASPAARISVSPNSGKVGDTFKFDATGSSADVGSIVNYQWSASLEGGTYDLSKTSGSSISEAFTRPGIYKITLTVTDSTNASDSTSTEILVESQTPVATFDYEVPKDNQPANVDFDASDSYDPDEGDTITYEWDFDGEAGTDYDILEGDAESSKATVQFLSVDDYTVTLKICDQHEDELQKCDMETKTVSIDSVLDVDLELDGDTARHLDDNGEAEAEFTAYSETATAFEINYGDGETDFTESISRGQAIFTHTYEGAGVFYATVTASDDNGNQNSITRRVYVATGDSPIAVINVTSNGEDIGFGDTLYGNVNTKFAFSATDSINVDGTNTSLSYSWNFGDGTTSSQSAVTHTYDEHTTYTVTLTVKDTKDPAVSDTASVYITIEGLNPEIRGISLMPQGDTLETPLKVNVTVDATDGDGSITYVKAWYYDLNNSAKELGTVIAQTTSFTLTVNTKGEQDEKVEYGFAVEVTDDDNNTVSSIDELSAGDIPTLKVTNGPNETPVANFSVDKSSVYIGEEITFSSTSYDPDGGIIAYWWDVEGDSFYNNEQQEEDSYSYTYSQYHSDGIDVQLKVEDDAGATAVSDVVTIYVDANSDPPEAKFLTYINGTTVTFSNNSAIDEENGATLQGIYWDFDLNTDSDGNGKTDDDFDSFEEEASYTYSALGTYEVTMTVVDSTGQMDTVTQTITLADANEPTASFTYSVDGKKASFKNQSEVDTGAGLEVREYRWDFDLVTDSDGDGDPENDSDSAKKNVSYEYGEYGDYEVTLTVVDTYGKEDAYTDTVELNDPLAAVGALLTSSPRPNDLSQILLDTDPSDITFYFSAENGSENYTYEFDKNIFYDTDGDGIKDNDVDYTAEASGSWKTTFYESYGQTVVKLTVTDADTGDTDVATLQVVFEGSLGSANLFNVTPSEMAFLLLSALLTAVLGVIMVFRYQPIKK